MQALDIVWSNARVAYRVDTTLVYSSSNCNWLTVWPCKRKKQAITRERKVSGCFFGFPEMATFNCTSTPLHPQSLQILVATAIICSKNHVWLSNWFHKCSMHKTLAYPGFSKGGCFDCVRACEKFTWPRPFMQPRPPTAVRTRSRSFAPALPSSSIILVASIVQRHCAAVFWKSVRRAISGFAG